MWTDVLHSLIIAHSPAWVHVRNSKMLDGNSSDFAHAIQNIVLILLSFAFLPLDVSIVLLSYARNVLSRREVGVGHKTSNPRTILVTGVGMTKGLTLARSFYKSGHRVIGADFESKGIVSPGRVSKALSNFYMLQKPRPSSGSLNYIKNLLDIIAKENVDLWISCSGVASAIEDGEAKEIIEMETNCKAIQFDIITTQTLHEKHSFMAYTQEIGLNTPETHTIISRNAVDRALRAAPRSRKYIMKTIGMNDQARGDMTLLPMDTNYATNRHLDQLKISPKDPWILQQFISGSEFCTHALVIRGRVTAFVACPSSELLMHYFALPADSTLSQAMLNFTKQYAAKGGPGFTGHLSFDFFVEDPSSKNIVLYPIECNPRAHTAVVLFNGTPAMTDAYMRILEDSERTMEPITPTTPNTQYYWIGHDLVAHLLYPLVQLLQGKTSISQVFREVVNLMNRLMTWKDGTFECWDPLPWFFLYHIYWPLKFFTCLNTGKKWSRVNVSTLKMFEC